MNITSKKIYFVCPDKKVPVGGVKQLYRQVEILKKNGFEAFIVHRKHGFRAKWFLNDVAIVYKPYIFHRIDKNRKTSFYYKVKYFFKGFLINCKEVESNSIIVFPETLAVHIEPDLFIQQKVIFNQNCYYTFHEYNAEKNNYHIYTDKNTLATIVVSNDSKNYLNYKFNDIKINRIRLGINSLFQFDDQKKKQIAFMPRKLSQDLVQIIQLLKDKKSLQDWKWIEIDNKTEYEVASILKESALFLSTNHIEGFGLPPAEAMACGCYVIGYTGNSGREYFDNQYSSIIESGDVLAFSREIEKIVDCYNENPSEILGKGKLASDFIQHNYNLDIEEQEILRTWKKYYKTLNQ